MNSLISIRSDKLNKLRSDLSSKLKTYGFAIAIILGIGGLVVGGVGLASYFHVGTLSNLNQVHVIIMMAAGGGGGFILFIAGVVGTIRSIDTQKRLVYGADAWRIWEIEVLDEVPPAPEIDWNENDPFFNEAYRDNYALLYIPYKIKVSNEEKIFTLPVLKEISDDFEIIDAVAKPFANNTSPRWVLVSKKVIPNSPKNYDVQEQIVEDQKGFSIPQTLEILVLNLMIFKLTKKWLNDSIYIRCAEKVNEFNPVLVGSLDKKSCIITSDLNYPYDCGVAVRKKF